MISAGQLGLMSMAERYALLPDVERAAALEAMTEEQLATLTSDWRFWARPKQTPPDGDWSTWLLRAGRGFGKSRAGAGWTSERAMETKRWIALVARTPADARDYMIEGPSGLLRTGKPEHRPIYEPSKRRLTWPNGTWATIYSDEEPDQLRGFSGDTAWLDEFGKFRNAQDVWDNLQFGMREVSADRPRRLITTTPRPIKILRMIEADPGTRTVTGSSYENRANLDPTWFKDTISKYEGTRLGRQEIHAEILDETPGALWSLKQLDDHRIRRVEDIPDMQRVVIGLDPNTAEPDDENIGLAECGIVVVGLGVDGRAYVLDDVSGHYGPAEWARKSLAALDRYEGDAIIAETNQGGAMVANTLRAVRRDIRVIEVHASRGKATRAEPVAALYEQGKVWHVGTHTTLEDQMTMFTPYGVAGGTTADRVDALVWALTHLFPKLIRRPDGAKGVVIEGLGGFDPKRFGEARR